MLPNFIIVGAPRSGTTSLYRYCGEHPDIYMSPFKETNFFSSNPHGFTRETYERLFQNVRDEVAIGEASPSYLYEEQAPYAIKNMIPECKIVIILRNPVDRLVSDFFYSQSWGGNLDMDFSQFVSVCLSENGSVGQGWAPSLLVKKGMYAQQVKRYVDLFGWENIFLRLHEDLKSDPVGLMRDFFTFLGVDSSFRPEVEEVHNANAEPIFPRLSQVVLKLRRFERVLIWPLLPSTMRGKLTEAMLAMNRRRDQAVKERHNRMVHYEGRYNLIGLYQSDVLELQKFIGRDLQAWLG